MSPASKMQKTPSETVKNILSRDAFYDELSSLSVNRVELDALAVCPAIGLFVENELRGVSRAYDRGRHLHLLGSLVW